jgi:hypothetical protein
MEVTYPNGVLVGDRARFQQELRAFRWEAYVGVYYLFDRYGRFVTDDISGNWLDCEIRRLLDNDSRRDSVRGGGGQE